MYVIKYKSHTYEEGVTYVIINNGTMNQFQYYNNMTVPMYIVLVTVF